MFKVLFKVFGIIGFLIGLLFSAAFIGTGSISLYQTLTGDLVSIGMFDLGLFMVTELGALPNPVSLIINLFLLFAGFYILKETCIGFLQEYFDIRFKEKRDRLKKQIEYASENQEIFQDLQRFILRLKDEDWYCSNPNFKL